MSQTILVVDDDPTNRELLEAILHLMDYRVVMAASSDQARSILRDTRPDLVILDVRLRYETEGLDLCRELKSTDTTASIRVAMISALDGESEQQAAKAAGADGFLRRGLEVPALLDQIAALLGGS
ncbi:MAG: response regulator [Anaerolineae bacterium]|nr:response regulator [Anaerolineae bacterium]